MDVLLELAGEDSMMWEWVEMVHRAAPAKLLCPASALQLGRKEI